MTNNFENTRQNTEEVKDMTSVRKASELKSLDELNLPKRIYNCVKDIQPEELIFLVRTRKKITGIGEKLSRKLEAAMDQAGFIRHDFDGRSFGVALLYRLINSRFSSAIGWPYASCYYFESNEAYERHENFSEAQIEAVNNLLGEFLSDKASLILQLRFGLKDGKWRTLADTAVAMRANGYVGVYEENALVFDEFECEKEDDENFGINTCQIERIERKSLRMLRACLSARSELDTILAAPAA